MDFVRAHERFFVDAWRKGEVTGTDVFPVDRHPFEKSILALPNKGGDRIEYQGESNGPGHDEQLQPEGLPAQRSFQLAEGIDCRRQARRDSRGLAEYRGRKSARNLK